MVIHRPRNKAAESTKEIGQRILHFTKKWRDRTERFRSFLNRSRLQPAREDLVSLTGLHPVSC